MEKIEVSNAIFTRAEFSTGAIINLLVSMHKTEMAVTIGISVVALHALASVINYVFSLKSIRDKD